MSKGDLEMTERKQVREMNLRSRFDLLQSFKEVFQMKEDTVQNCPDGDWEPL